MARTFPADLLLRVWAALLELSRLGLDYWGPPPDALPGDGLIFRIATFRTAVVAWVASAVPGITLVPLVVPIALAAFSVRLSLLAIAAWIFFGAMSSLQFQTRHVVHLELFPLLFTALAIVGVTRGIRALCWYRPNQRTAYIRSAVVVSAIAFITAVGIIVPLQALRSVQAPRVRAMLSEYGRHLGPPLTFSSTVGHGTALIVPVEGPGLPPVQALRRQFYSAGLGGAACDFEEVSAMVRYETSNPSFDFSHPLPIRTRLSAEKLTHAWFATYDHKSANGREWYRFAGLEVPAEMAPCVVSLARAETQQDLLINATLPPNWENRRLYSILNRWESDPEAAPLPTTYTFPPERRVRITELQRQFTPLGRTTEVHGPQRLV